MATTRSSVTAGAGPCVRWSEVLRRFSHPTVCVQAPVSAKSVRTPHVRRGRGVRADARARASVNQPCTAWWRSHERTARQGGNSRRSRFPLERSPQLGVQLAGSVGTRRRSDLASWAARVDVPRVDLPADDEVPPAVLLVRSFHELANGSRATASGSNWPRAPLQVPRRHHRCNRSARLPAPVAALPPGSGLASVVGGRD